MTLFGKRYIEEQTGEAMADAARRASAHA